MNENEVNNLISENISLKAELLVLREKNNIYQKFNQLSPDIVIVVDTNYLYQYIHIPNVPAIVLDGLLGKDIISTTPAVLRPAMVEALEKVSKRKEVVVYESEGESMGSYKYYLNYLAPILDEKNNVTHIYFLSKDITTQKKSEIENKSLQQKLNTLFQSTKHIYTIFDTERNVIWFNEESKRITNLAFNINIKIGSNAKDEFSPTVFESFNQQFEKAKLGSPVKYTRKYLIENEHIFYEFTFYPIIENGIPIAIAHVGIDVTELAIKEENSKNINRQLVLQNQQLNQYSNIISHNLRGPISTLMGIANVIDKCNDDQMAKEILFGQIKPIIEKLDRIIIDMNLPLNHTYQLDLGWENVELNTLLDDIKDIIDISKNDQILIKNDFKKVPMLYTIKGYIHSILFNLLSNAIKYKKSNQKAIISIKTHKAMGDKICLEIADNGIGIDLNLHGKKIFGFHKRFHNHVEGRGMGLHMTKTQIELMGGSIEVESKVMVGTKFKIYLPVNSSQIE